MRSSWVIALTLEVLLRSNAWAGSWDLSAHREVGPGLPLASAMARSPALPRLAQVDLEPPRFDSSNSAPAVKALPPPVKWAPPPKAVPQETPPPPVKAVAPERPPSPAKTVAPERPPSPAKTVAPASPPPPAKTVAPASPLPPATVATPQNSASPEGPAHAEKSKQAEAPPLLPRAEAVAPAPSTSGVALASRSSAPSETYPAEGSKPLYKTWWFWTATVGVLAAGTVTAIVLSRGTDHSCGSLAMPCVGVK